MQLFRFDDSFNYYKLMYYLRLPINLICLVIQSIHILALTVTLVTSTLYARRKKKNDITFLLYE